MRRPRLETEDYGRFSRELPWKDQGRDLLPNAKAFSHWVDRFRPASGVRYGNRVPSLEGGVGFGFEVLPPSSYPAIVIYTRIRRTGLTECEFYWDYVCLSDFTPPGAKGVELIRTSKAEPKKSGVRSAKK
jgi:hypothetical protein